MSGAAMVEIPEAALEAADHVLPHCTPHTASRCIHH